MGINNSIVKCECGKTWRLTRVKMPYGARDSDSAACTCGREVISWNGGHVYVIEEVNTSESNLERRADTL